MKLTVFITLLIFFFSCAQAQDIACQSDLTEPKLNPALIMADQDEPADITVAEARLRLKESRSNNTDDAHHEPTEPEEPAQTNREKANSKKESRLGGIFDILLPSKQRNPVR